MELPYWEIPRCLLKEARDAGLFRLTYNSPILLLDNKECTDVLHCSFYTQYVGFISVYSTSISDQISFFIEKMDLCTVILISAMSIALDNCQPRIQNLSIALKSKKIKLIKN